MWVKKKDYIELFNKLDFLVNSSYSLTGKLRAIELDLAIAKKKLDMIYQDQCSDWADDDRRTRVLPLSGNLEVSTSHFRELLDSDE